ncbi:MULTISPECIES: YqgE/AlgH family protein [Alteromonadaceae]|uniref:YqgE/AlgH family protein n=1 Tax=Alteromonadaceae TaxID=72275 RepID=UPI001C07F2AF|nr:MULTISPECIES: YqgE/AlgH family protein [Aliiglaciecola]MBU2876584.1 YqgE/AlgH family protein [Aliiglaciecola lipolytica]MDO6711481.1 YqgE/AlgH family protein [Aliiglaciecola sp. 2_MG-2023]MDO6752542.1 YqgE/AlgH family protein [Aliiglaciecola sp. 1_MG-2023]
MQSFEHHLLVAMPSLDDPYFARSLTYICEHNDKGAMGLVINQPIGMSLQELITQADKDAIVLAEKADEIVLAGGPVSQDRGFILHTTQPGWSSSLQLTSEIMITTSKDILSALGNEKAPAKSLVTLGYAGWTAGQLEEEVQNNSWLIVEADEELLFDVPIHKKWEEAVRKLGIDVWQLGPDAGHA